MLEKIIRFCINNKLIVILFTFSITGFGLFAVFHIPVGSVPDITNNQVQVITTSGNLSTQEIEQFITTPVEMEMANITGVQEIRSVSKFGISLVTVVFDEKWGPICLVSLSPKKLKVPLNRFQRTMEPPRWVPLQPDWEKFISIFLT